MARDPRKIASEYRSLSEIMMEDGLVVDPPASHKFRLCDLEELVVVRPKAVGKRGHSIHVT